MIKMLKNNNQEAVKRISRRSLKQNRIRNMFAVLAIILTTFMFTTVFSIGFSLGKNMNIMMLREQGTKSTIYLDNPTEDQILKAGECRHLNAAGIKINTGTAQSKKNSETVIALDYYKKLNSMKISRRPSVILRDPILPEKVKLCFQELLWMH